MIRMVSEGIFVWFIVEVGARGIHLTKCVLLQEQNLAKKKIR